MDEKKELKDEEVSEVSGGKGKIDSLKQKMNEMLRKLGVKKPKPMLVAYGGPELGLPKIQGDVKKSTKSTEPEFEK